MTLLTSLPISLFYQIQFNYLKDEIGKDVNGVNGDNVMAFCGLPLFQGSPVWQP